MSTPPVIAISLGDPAGAGPELVARLMVAPESAGVCIPVVYGGRAVWERACAVAGVPDTLQEVAHAGEASGPSLVVCDDTPVEALPWSLPGAAAGRAQLRYLERAVDDLVAGHAQGLCTAPVNKAAIARVGSAFVGHTEYLLARFGVQRVVMLMAGERLRVALATTHVALSEVPGLLDGAELVATLELLSRELRERFQIARPRIAVCGLNPHAGEEGSFGDEEIRIILPAVEEARRAGLEVDGPFAADGLFPRVDGLGYDAVLAMYHDQGLIPFKMREFHTGVNVTLGLPRPRTSPDHGVAYDLAGTGRADPRSMIAALRLCASLATGGA